MIINKICDPISSISKWPKEERPREKLLSKGEQVLTNIELLAILLRTGAQGMSALDLARILLSKAQSFGVLSTWTSRDYSCIKGIGFAKIAHIKAALEIGRRFREEQVRITEKKIYSSQDVFHILHPRMRDLKKEKFLCVYLTQAHVIARIVAVEDGTVNRAHPIIREIFEEALHSAAAALICAHNHPSGNPSPSKEDVTFTYHLVHAGRTLDIPVLDHLIIGANTYYSFRDEGRLSQST